jgi:TRAP transporter TAXI family solute receptor
MKRHLAAILAVGSTLALGLVAAAGLGSAQTEPQRLSFVIDTGSTGGTYFPIGEAMADIISHPPGVARCEAADVCGPSGLIASARSSAGTIANVLDVNSHRADAALAQSDVVADAVAGKGAFKIKQSHIRIIADLFPEEVHVVAAKAANIRSIADLKGKRVSIGDASSGTIVTARAVLAAWRIPEARLKANYDAADIAADKLAHGEIDAIFFTGGAPVPLVRDLIVSGKAVLIPIDGAGRKRLIAADPDLAAGTIDAGIYPGTGAVQTVSVRAIWIVNDQVAADIVYGVAKALFNPANRETLDGSHPSAALIRLDSATAILPAPLHPGAARFYREMGKAVPSSP